MSTSILPKSFEAVRSRAERTLFGLINRTLTPAVRLGIGSPLPIGGGVVLVETTGRVSGAPREVPLLAVRAGNKVTVSTGRGNSQWMRNLEADPRAIIWLNGRPTEATATVARGPLNVATLTLSK